MRQPEEQSRPRAPLLAGAATVAAVAVVHLVDPNQPGSYGFCPLRLATGVLCPFCGGLRAVHALTHGQLETAWGLNPALVATTPLVLALWLVWAVRAFRGPGSVPGTLPGSVRVGPAWAMLTGIVAFGVLRNVPALQPHLAALT